MSSEAGAVSFPVSVSAPDANLIESRNGALSRLGSRALRIAAAAWLAVALTGQCLFATYVFGLYGRAVLTGNSQGWNAVMKHGYVPGDTFGNLVVVLHVAFAFVVMAAGGVQLIPAVRRRWPRFHRWNGRGYVLATLLMAAGGLVMLTTRNRPDQPVMVLAQALDALLIALCAVQAWRHALARCFDVHRRWAMRLYLVASAAWFFRIGLMFWVVVNGGPVGFDPKTFTGPFITFLAFAQYLLPLALLELYLRAQAARATARLGMAALLGAMTLVTAGGIAAATLVMWLPRL